MQAVGETVRNSAQWTIFGIQNSGDNESGRHKLTGQVGRMIRLREFRYSENFE